MFWWMMIISFGVYPIYFVGTRTWKITKLGLFLWPLWGLPETVVSLFACKYSWLYHVVNWKWPQMMSLRKTGLCCGGSNPRGINLQYYIRLCYNSGSRIPYWAAGRLGNLDDFNVFFWLVILFWNSHRMQCGFVFLKWVFPKIGEKKQNGW